MLLGYSYESDIHCVECANERFGDDDGAIDREGNGVYPVFCWDTLEDDCYCGTCQELVYRFENGVLVYEKFIRL